MDLLDFSLKDLDVLLNFFNGTNGDDVNKLYNAVMDVNETATVILELANANVRKAQFVASQAQDTQEAIEDAETEDEEKEAADKAEIASDVSVCLYIYICVCVCVSSRHCIFFSMYSFLHTLFVEKRTSILFESYIFALNRRQK